MTKEVGTKTVSKAEATAASRIQGAKELGQKMIRAAAQKQAYTQATAKLEQLAAKESHATSREGTVKSALGGLLKTKLTTTRDWEAAGRGEDAAEAALSAAKTASLKLGESAQSTKTSAIQQLATMEVAAKKVEKRASTAKVAADAKEHTAKLGAIRLMKETVDAKNAVQEQKKRVRVVKQASAKAGDALVASKQASEVSAKAATAEEVAKQKMAKLPAGKETELMEARSAAINARAVSSALSKQVGGSDAEAEQEKLHAQVAQREVDDAKQAAMILGNHVAELNAIKSQLVELKAVHSRAHSLLQRAEVRSTAARKLEKSATKTALAQIHDFKVKMATTSDHKLVKLYKLKIAGTKKDIAQLDADSHQAHQQMLEHQAMATKTGEAVDMAVEQANRKKAQIVSENAVQAAVKKAASKVTFPTLKESQDSDESDSYIAALKSSRQATREQDLANEAKGKATSADNIAKAAMAKAAATHAEKLSVLYTQHAAVANKVPGRVMLLSEEEGFDSNRLQKKIREAHMLRQQARQKMRAMGDPIPDSLQPGAMQHGSMENIGESDEPHPSAAVQAIQATHPHLKASIERSEKAEAEQKKQDDEAAAKNKKKHDVEIAKKQKKKADNAHSAHKAFKKNKKRKAQLKKLKHQLSKKDKAEDKAEAKADKAEAKAEARAFNVSLTSVDKNKKQKAKKKKKMLLKLATKEAKKGVEKTEKQAEKRLSKVQAATEKALATKRAAEKMAANAEKKEAKALKAKANAEKSEAKSLTAASDAKEAKKVGKSVDKAQLAAKMSEKTSKWSRKLLKQEGINVPKGSMEELAKKLTQNQEHISKLTKEISSAFFARMTAKAKLYKAGKTIPKNLQAGALVERLTKEGVPLDLILKAKAKGTKEAASSKKIPAVPVPKIPSTKDAMKSGDPMVDKISKVKQEEKALEVKVKKLKKENSKFDVNKKLAEKTAQEAKMKKEKKDAWIANNKNTARMMNKMAKDAKKQQVAMKAVSNKEKLFKVNHLIKMAQKKEVGAKFMKKHGPKRFKHFAKWDTEKVFNEEIVVKKRLAYQSKHGRHLILRTLSAQYILRNRENKYLRAGVGVLIALAGKMPVYPAIRTMRGIDASLQNDATALLPKPDVTSQEKKVLPALNDQLTKQTMALGLLVAPGVVVNSSQSGPLIEAFDQTISAHQMLNNATTKVETRIAVEAEIEHKIPISKEEVAAASWKAAQAKMDMDRLTQQLKVLRDVLPAPVSKLQADLPGLYNAQLRGLTSLKLQLKAIKASKSPHATPMLAEQDAQLKKRILEVTRGMVRYNSTKDTKANLLQDFLHHGRMQSCLTKEVEILTTIVSLEHTMSRTMLKKNKQYLVKREESMQKEMNDLSVERANRLKEEITQMYKQKIVVMRQKESILKEVRRLLQRRLFRKLPKEDMLKEVDHLLRAKNKADKALLEEKVQLRKQEKKLAKATNQTVTKSESVKKALSPVQVERRKEQAQAARELKTYERERRKESSAMKKLTSAETKVEKEQRVVGAEKKQLKQQLRKSSVDIGVKKANREARREQKKEASAAEAFKIDKVRLETNAAKSGDVSTKQVAKVRKDRAKLRKTLRKEGKPVPADLKPRGGGSRGRRGGGSRGRRGGGSRGRSGPGGR